MRVEFSGVYQKTSVAMGMLVLAEATRLARRGELARAEALLLPLVEQEVWSPGSLDLLAKIRAQQGRLTEGRSLWARALEKEPENPDLKRAFELSGSPEAGKPRLWRLAVLGSAGLVLLFCFFAAFFAILGPRGGVVEPQRGAQIEESGKDEVLVASVESALKRCEDIAQLPLAVVQENGVVRIRGEVPNLYARYLVEKVVRSVPGVKLLDLSELRVAGIYMVRPGDSLWAIAGRLYGDPSFWEVLAKENGLGCPYVLHPGQKLKVPLPGA